MIVLGIETSCDETAAAVVEDGSGILSNRIASQVEIHARYGGIVPEVASRQHILAIVPVIAGAMADANVGWDRIDGIAVTIGPGLAGSLLTGVNAAKAIRVSAWTALVFSPLQAPSTSTSRIPPVIGSQATARCWRK